MDANEAARRLEELEPVPVPADGPTYDHIFGNQIRWTASVLRYERYRWRVRRLERAMRAEGDVGATHRTRKA